MPTRRSLGAASLAVAAIARRATAQPQPWPGTRPIEVIVPVPPGGGLDSMARLALQHVVPRLGPGARAVVVNRPGAGSQIGTEAAFHAAPDGWTLAAISLPLVAAMPIERAVRYRPLEFTWIANVVDDPNAFFVAADSPLRTLADLAAAARARPGTLSYGSTGIGSDDHIAMLAYEQAERLPALVHVPFPGTAPGQQALLGGHISLLVGNISEGLALMRDGRIRVLGVAGTARFDAAPDAPTFREQGFDFVAGASRGFVAPPGIPPEVRARLEAAFAEAMADPAFLADAARVGMPLRPVVGAAYRQMAATVDEDLRVLWQKRPWKE